jgi:hypothetical protein
MLPPEEEQEQEQEQEGGKAQLRIYSDLFVFNDTE